MLSIVWHTQFKKDFKNAKKRGKKLEKLTHIITELQNGQQLPPKNKNHNSKAIMLIVGNVILSQIGF